MMQDLDGHLVKPMPSGSYRAIVFVFLRIDCPISNRYAPELRRLHDKFASQGVALRLIFPEAGDSGPAIRAIWRPTNCRARPCAIRSIAGRIAAA